MKIELTRTFICTILMGIFLSTNSYGENMPAPIPIDFGVNDGMRNDRFDCNDQDAGICIDCNVEYDCPTLGATCCDHAIALDSLYNPMPSLTCEILETAYYWNCSGCECSDWDNGDNEWFYQWTTDFGCTDISACNYNTAQPAMWDDGSCEYA